MYRIGLLAALHPDDPRATTERVARELARDLSDRRGKAVEVWDGLDLVLIRYGSRWYVLEDTQ